MWELIVFVFAVVPAFATRAHKRDVSKGIYVAALIAGFASIWALDVYGLLPAGEIVRWVWVGGVFLVVEFLANRGRTAARTWQCPSCRKFNEPRTLRCLCGTPHAEAVKSDRPADAGRATRPPKRVLVLFCVGQPFGGLRLAISPRRLAHSDSPVFVAMERAIQNIRAVMATYPQATWSRLASSDAVLGDAAEFFETRPCDFHTMCDLSSTTSDVVIRAFAPFRLWPVGGWALYDAWHRELDGRWVAFSDRELNEVW